MNLTNIVKPTRICNLSCKYCYNEDTRAPIMTTSTLARVIQESFKYCEEFPEPSSVTFLWHGGEPMVAKLPFFKQAVELQKQYQKNVQCSNTIQTNGTLINDEWIKFLKDNKFSVSIILTVSDLNDANRIYHDGKGSFQSDEGNKFNQTIGYSLWNLCCD